MEVLKGGSAKFVVNAPMVPPDQKDRIEPYAVLAQKMEGRQQTLGGT